MKEMKKAAGIAAYHGMILLRGAAKMLYGTAMAALITLTVDGFTAIPSEGGYAAVCSFIFAVSMATIVLGGLYLFGGKKRGHS